MKVTKYSVWARHFKDPLAKEGEDLFGAVCRIATSFVGRGYATKRILKNPKLDDLISHLMKLADNKIIAEVCYD